MANEAYQAYKRTLLDENTLSMKSHENMTKKRLNTFSSISIKTSRLKTKGGSESRPKPLYPDDPGI